MNYFSPPVIGEMPAAMLDRRRVCPCKFELLIAQERNVGVSAQTRVVRQVITVVVRVFVDNYFVRAPVPAGDQRQIGFSNGEIEAVKPKTRRSASAEMPDMLGTEAGREMAVLPWMIDMETRIVSAGIMAHPFIAVDVRYGRMAASFRRLHRLTVRLWLGRCGTASRRTAGLKVVMLFAALVFLRKSG